MKKFRKPWNSMSIRISMILFVVLLVIGWCFTKGIMGFLRMVTNHDRCDMMISMVTNHISGEIGRVESVMEAGALSASTKRLTAKESKKVCERIRRMCDIDTVYIAFANHNGAPAVDTCLTVALDSAQSMWTEPHYQPANDTEARPPVVTYITPIRDEKGKIYAVLCGDMRFDWLRKLAHSEARTDLSLMKVSSAQGLYLCHPDSTQVMTRVIPDTITEEWRGKNNIFVQAYEQQKQPATQMSKHISGIDWDIECSIPFHDKSGMNRFVHAAVIGLLIIMFAFVVLAIIICVRWQLRPLHDLALAAEEVSKGNFSFELPKLKNNTEIKEFRDSFERMQIELEHYIEDLRRTTEHEASMERDIRIAATIQNNMIPKDLEELSDRDDIDICGMSKPAREVGGDLYNCVLNDGKLLFCLGDVSGKGIPAALFMSVVIHLFRNVALHTSDPVEIAGALNSEVAHNNEDNMFCTLFVGVLDLSTGVLNFCNAGHNPPLFIQGDKVDYLPTEPDMPLGVFDDTEYHLETVTLNKLDALFLYTDGVNEAENVRKELFGEERTLETVAAHATSHVTEIVNAVKHDVTEFAKGAEQSDDLTMLCLRYGI